MQHDTSHAGVVSVQQRMSPASSRSQMVEDGIGGLENAVNVWAQEHSGDGSAARAPEQAGRLSLGSQPTRDGGRGRAPLLTWLIWQ
jgi:hypothetical protein